MRHAQWTVRSVVMLGVLGTTSLVSASEDVVVPEVLSPRFDASYEDTRTQREIQELIASGLAISGGDPEDFGPRAMCFAPGSTPTPEMIEMVNGLIADSFQTRYQTGATWPGSTGTVRLRWSFVPDGTLAPDLNNALGASALFATLDAQWGNRNWIPLFEQSFARWGALMGIEYVRVEHNGNPWDDGAAWGNAGAENTRGDVRIAMRPFSNNNVLAFNSFPTNGDMVVNQNVNWRNDSANNWRFMRNVIMHEHGHGLGLFHVCPIANVKLMEPFLSTAFDGPQQDDIRGAQALYGDIYEPNNAASAASDLGALTAGINRVFGIPTVSAPTPANSSSIGVIDGDQDWFQFTLDQPRLVTFVTRPLGNSYEEGDQNQACTSDGVIDGLRQGDLVMTIIGANGTTIYRSVNDGGLGVNEQASSLLVPNGRTYVRITENGTTSRTQMYQLQIWPLTAPLAPTASDGTFADRVAISWPGIPDATGYRILRNTTQTTAGAQILLDGLSASTTSANDTTAQPGVQYYYFVYATQTGSSLYRAMNTTGEAGSVSGPSCNDIDFNNDGLFPSDEDLLDFFAVSAGGACSTGDCDSIDFNNDGLFPSDDDLIAFLRVLAGGPC